MRLARARTVYGGGALKHGCATESIESIESNRIGVGLRGGEVWPAHAYLSSMPAFSRPLSSEKNEPLFDTFPQPRLTRAAQPQPNQRFCSASGSARVSSQAVAADLLGREVQQAQRAVVVTVCCRTSHEPPELAVNLLTAMH